MAQPSKAIREIDDQTLPREAVVALARIRTELEQALQDARIAREELASANRAKDRLLAALSHELRTPLTPIVTAVQLLTRCQDLPLPAREALEVIRRNVRIESNLIDDLLEATRIARGKIETEAGPIDMHEAITGAVEMCLSDIRCKAQQLTLELNASHYRIDGDFTRLQRVVCKLLRNASKFTPEGGAISLRSRSDEGRFLLTVSDNGVGIEREALSNIFDAFGQGDASMTREFGGLGLGLAISKATVEAHGGNIRAHSEGRGQGATFTVELPMR